MASRSYPCRHCGTVFTPQSGKPGYVDECPDCLHEKTRRKPPVDFAARFIAQYPKRRKAFKDLRKALQSLGIDEADVDNVIADCMRRAGTQI